ncbi:hypothetical protein BJ875DRAFT_464217 [Amylocarpus encephaloides]|uniref:Uncharacterized protein n=1 Tax=Amylocarpus encephaloides TaxID=45428 RepID=A0A9P7YI53_9HELO|nr:hypothetical protein BJ875DRAFT_464217 [Amylocarpus encephaloides]
MENSTTQSLFQPLSPPKMFDQGRRVASSIYTSTTNGTPSKLSPKPTNPAEIVSKRGSMKKISKGMTDTTTLKCLVRSLSENFSQATRSKCPSSSVIVEDHSELVSRGYCPSCTATRENYTCLHSYLTSAHMCNLHSGLPLGVESLNFTPYILNFGRPCTSCSYREQYEGELQFFLKYRKMSGKAWGKEKATEERMLKEMERVRELSVEEWDAEKNIREAIVAKGDEIRGLEKGEAKGREKGLREHIEHFSVKMTRRLTVR